MRLKTKQSSVLFWNWNANVGKISSYGPDDGGSTQNESMYFGAFIKVGRFHPFLQATEALRESRGIALLWFYNNGISTELSVKHNSSILTLERRN
jgi:hypothetical protein